MRVVVIGGSGLIGSKLVTRLDEHGHEAVAASPDSGVNTLTGDGLAEALDSAAVVVDVSNSPSFDDAAVLEFFETSTSNLLAAEAAAGVGHHVALSVVGTERLSESGYFRAKIAQEQLIRDSSIPYSIVHATQFFEFVKSIAAAATDGDTVRLAPALIQPIAADDVARAVGLRSSVKDAAPRPGHANGARIAPGLGACYAKPFRPTLQLPGKRTCLSNLRHGPSSSRRRSWRRILPNWAKRCAPSMRPAPTGSIST